MFNTWMTRGWFYRPLDSTLPEQRLEFFFRLGQEGRPLVSFLLCIIAFLILTGCSTPETVTINDSFEPFIAFEASQYSHPFVLNAWVRNDGTTEGFIEFDMAYRLERFTDSDWQCLAYINPPDFPDRIVRLFAGEWSNAYVQSWYLTYGKLIPGKYRIWKTFRYYGEQYGIKYFDLYAVFYVSDMNDAIEWKGEIVRFHTITEFDVENSSGLLREGMPILLARIGDTEITSSNDTKESLRLFSLWLDVAIVIDALGNAMSFDDIPIGANIDIIGFGHLGIDGIIGGDHVEHLRSVRLVKVTR